MKRIDFWFDPVSPYAYLAFEHLPEALEGCSYTVEYRPVLFAGLLAHWGQKGPAEMEPKRRWTYRQVAWQAHRLGIPLDLPAVHPFNPLALLRLAVAAGPNRRVVEAVMRHAWRGGADAADAVRLGALERALAPAREPGSSAVKAELRAQTDAAIARGVFGVPTFEVDGQCFWGLDALPMLRAWLQGDPWYQGGAWDSAQDLRPHVERRPPK
ncbi:MAG TPA: 2-hydroxychromene-2-carboxylate isomerase [Burkholderiaceae bacterium]|nr:2-hydroxychromene-2-carboxylate isomerase [Burkholderiaceae bacterium]